MKKNIKLITYNLFLYLYLFDSAKVPLFFNLLSNNKIWDVTKVKAFADDKIKFAKRMIPLFHRVENDVGKGENDGYQLSKGFLYGSLKVWIV